MDAVPPKISPLPKMVPMVVAAVSVVTAAGLLYFFNPSVWHIYPVCMFHQLTGWNCPGCGGTRAIYALLHGQLWLALRDNALAVLGLLALAGRSVWLAWHWLHGRRPGPILPSRWLIPLLVVMVAFGILRNLPWFAFLSPPS